MIIDEGVSTSLVLLSGVPAMTVPQHGNSFLIFSQLNCMTEGELGAAHVALARHDPFGEDVLLE